MGILLPSVGALLSACGDAENGAESADVVVGTPDDPRQQPLFDDNPAIESGLPAEEGPLLLYNWGEGINPETIPLAEEAIGASIEITTFFNLEESIQKLSSGEVQFDVWWPTAAYIGKAVAGGLIQPLNLDYIPNLGGIWPALADPFYDQSSRYSVPYIVYQTGIGWRTDMVDDADVETLTNPWLAFWNPKYKDITGLYKDFQETLSMAMFRNGIADPAAASADEVAAAADSLIELVDLMNIQYTIDGAYDGIPNARFGLHHAWSGDMVGSVWYFPEDGDTSVLRYAWPPNVPGSTVKGIVGNDTMTVLAGAPNPVLAHRFLDFMLGEDGALSNFEWYLYQPPLTSLDPDTLIADEWVVPNLESAIVRQEDFANPLANVPVQLEPDVESVWLDEWNRVQASG